MTTDSESALGSVPPAGLKPASRTTLVCRSVQLSYDGPARHRWCQRIGEFTDQVRSSRYYLADAIGLGTLIVASVPQGFKPAAVDVGRSQRLERLPNGGLSPVPGSSDRAGQPR